MACSLVTNLDGLQGGDVAAGADASTDVTTADAPTKDAGDAGAVGDSSLPIDAALTPIDFVQVNANSLSDAGVIALSLAPVKPGNTLLVAIWMAGTAVTPVVTDDTGDTFTPVVGPYGSAHDVTD